MGAEWKSSTAVACEWMYAGESVGLEGNGLVQMIANLATRSWAVSFPHGHLRRTCPPCSLWYGVADARLLGVATLCPIASSEKGYPLDKASREKSKFYTLCIVVKTQTAALAIAGKPVGRDHPRLCSIAHLVTHCSIVIPLPLRFICTLIPPAFAFTTCCSKAAGRGGRDAMQMSHLTDFSMH